MAAALELGQAAAKKAQVQMHRKETERQCRQGRQPRQRQGPGFAAAHVLVGVKAYKTVCVQVLTPPATGVLPPCDCTLSAFCAINKSPSVPYSQFDCRRWAMDPDLLPG